MATLALYTTVHPGTERFLADWHRSVQGQTDQDFELWIGVDELEVETVERALGGLRRVTWVPAANGDTPAQVRQRALAQIVESCDVVVMVDSDDILHPSRVAAARSAMRTSEVAGCALRVVDEHGRDVGIVMRPPVGTAPDEVLPRHNIYGLSNSAYSCEALRRCLPIPDQVALVDWFLITRAWLLGTALGFDSQVRMDYRQHGANTARIRPPFAASQVIDDTELVRSHFEFVRASQLSGALADRLALLEQAATDAEEFRQRVILDRERLERYVRELNAMPVSPLWWSCVANPSLRHLWATEEGET